MIQPAVFIKILEPFIVLCKYIISMNKDSETTIQELKNKLKKFRDERNWKQFHDPKNLAEAIAVECGELQELFLWKDKKRIIDDLEKNKEFKREVGEELADVIIFCLNFANTTDLDISSIIKEKIRKNDKKYDRNKARNRADKYNKL